LGRKRPAGENNDQWYLFLPVGGWIFQTDKTNGVIKIS
jgi:hypothetical protein